MEICPEDKIKAFNNYIRMKIECLLEQDKDDMTDGFITLFYNKIYSYKPNLNKTEVRIDVPENVYKYKDEYIFKIVPKANIWTQCHFKLLLVNKYNREELICNDVYSWVDFETAFEKLYDHVNKSKKGGKK